jgi:hypothetical protein
MGALLRTMIGMEPLTRVMRGTIIACFWFAASVGALAAKEAQDKAPEPPKIETPVQANPPAVGEKPPEPKSVPLTYWNRDIALFRATVTKLTPVERAAAASERLAALADQLDTTPVHTDPLEIDGQKGVRFLVGDQYIFSLVEDYLDKLAG